MFLLEEVTHNSGTLPDLQLLETMVNPICWVNSNAFCPDIMVPTCLLPTSPDGLLFSLYRPLKMMQRLFLSTEWSYQTTYRTTSPVQVNIISKITALVTSGLLGSIKLLVIIIRPYIAWHQDASGSSLLKLTLLRRPCWVTPVSLQGMDKITGLLHGCCLEHPIPDECLAPSSLAFCKTFKTLFYNCYGLEIFFLILILWYFVLHCKLSRNSINGMDRDERDRGGEKRGEWVEGRREIANRI